MSNQTKRYNKKASSPSMDKYAMARWVGFTDYMQGYGFRKEYDTWSKPGIQIAYERGRGDAAVLKATFNRIFTWPRNRKLFATLIDKYGIAAEWIREVLLPQQRYYNPKT